LLAPYLTYTIPFFLFLNVIRKILFACAKLLLLLLLLLLLSLSSSSLLLLLHGKNEFAEGSKILLHQIRK